MKIYTIAGIMGLVASAAVGAGREYERPNIVLLFADDLGWSDTGCYGSTYYETPNIDRLCRQGMKFTDAHSAAANCAPSRACLITGQYIPRHGVYTVSNRSRFDKETPWDDRPLLSPENAKHLPDGCETIGTAMHQAGYKTAYFGKWHTGWGGPLPMQAYKEDLRGFDKVLLSGGRHYDIVTWPKPEQPIPSDIYLSDYLTDNALDFLERNQAEPFFLFFADFLVHLPEQAPEQLIEKYKNKPTSGPQKNPTYAAMVESLDKSIGRILDKLDKLGLSDNTLVYFTSDNGGDHRTSNRPLRGMKGMFYEGGMRVPAIARWPKRIPAGTICEVPVCGIDLFPTFAALSGSPVNKETYLLDGENLMPILSGEEKSLDRDLFWYTPGYLPGRSSPSAVIRNGNYKLIHYFEDDHVELFNLKNDLGEDHDLAIQMPEVAQQLKQKLDAWRERTGAVIPPRNPEPKVGVMELLPQFQR